MIWLGKFWYFGKLVTKERWSLTRGGRNRRFDSIPLSFFIYFVFNKAARPQVIYPPLTWFASWPADLQKAAMLAAECEDSGRPTFKDGHVLCHLSSISYRVLLFLNIDMTAHAQSEKIWVEYKGLKFYLKTTVALPIGDVTCDNTDSNFTAGAISCFVYPSTNRTIL